MIHLEQTRECFESHLGLWAIEPTFLEAAIGNYIRGTGYVLPVVYQHSEEEQTVAKAQASEAQITRDGLAVVRLTGPMMKGRSKFGGTSTIDLRRQVRAAKNDEAVGAILMIVDSPGGRVDGTHELAEDVRRAAEAKPFWVHIEDLGASAALWASSHATRILINGPGEAGSIGTFAVVVDESGKAEAEGIKVHVISTGSMKGAARGAPVSEEVLEEVRRRMEAKNGFFMRAMQAGRSLSDEQLADLATGEVFPSSVALGAGLVDAIQSLEDTVREVSEISAKRLSSRSPRAAVVDQDEEALSYLT